MEWAIGSLMIRGREIVRILFAPPLLAASIAFAGDPWIVTGRVVGISDGDTITVLDDAQTQHKIRFAGIDAPEKGQAFGERSKQSLSTRRFTEQVYCRRFRPAPRGGPLCVLRLLRRRNILVRARAPRAVDQAALGQSRCDSTTSRATSAIASVAATPIVASCHGCSCA